MARRRTEDAHLRRGVAVRVFVPGPLGETLREFANLAAAALGLSQFIGQQPRSWWLLLAAMSLWLAFVSLALMLEGD
ncbi:MAG: hypothetical protein ABL993_14920, partial [Vicinamibacterales bacterium]